MYQIYVCIYVCMILVTFRSTLTPHPPPLPLPPLGSQQKEIPLVFADFRRFCLLVSLRVQIFIVLRLWSYDDSNTENI